MCGRYDLSDSPAVVQLHFRLGLVPAVPPRFNIAPGQLAPIVRCAASAQRACAMSRWGLIPFWSKNQRIGYRTINARAETLATAPAFREAYKRRRCIVPASGFFEWKRSERSKQPYRIKPAEAPLFGLAGLWETWRAPEGETVQSYTIVTTEAAGLVRELHDRMPLILAPEDYGKWLNADRAEADVLLRLPTRERLLVYPVTTRVNDARFDDPTCIEPIAMP